MYIWLPLKLGGFPPQNISVFSNGSCVYPKALRARLPPCLFALAVPTRCTRADVDNFNRTGSSKL